MVTAAPAPKPAIVRPAANPRRSGNHLSALPIVVLHIALAPMPLTTAAAYNSARELAWEFRSHPNPTPNPPIAAPALGPNVSTNQPSAGTSQVSVTTKIVNAN